MRFWECSLWFVFTLTCALFPSASVLLESEFLVNNFLAYCHIFHSLLENWKCEHPFTDQLLTLTDWMVVALLVMKKNTMYFDQVKSLPLESVQNDLGYFWATEAALRGPQILIVVCFWITESCRCTDVQRPCSVAVMLPPVAALSLRSSCTIFGFICIVLTIDLVFQRWTVLPGLKSEANGMGLTIATSIFDLPVKITFAYNPVVFSSTFLL